MGILTQARQPRARGERGLSVVPGVYGGQMGSDTNAEAAASTCVNRYGCNQPGSLTRCALCPHSLSYLRLPENRADRQPYKPLPALDDPNSPVAV